MKCPECKQIIHIQEAYSNGVDYSVEVGHLNDCSLQYKELIIQEEWKHGQL